MSDGRCETCKHWSRHYGDDVPQWGDCELTTSDDLGIPQHPESLARVSDGEYWLMLETRGDFGCVMYEARE